MIENFKKLLQKKAQEQANNPPDSKKMEAKASVMKELSDMLKGKMKGDMMDGLKKVTVASNTPEGLKTGLELAKEKMSELSPKSCESCEGKGCEKCEMEESDESEEESEDMEEGYESPAQESSEEMSPDMEIAELEKKIADLKAKKA
jgi:hypothetical protein